MGKVVSLEELILQRQSWKHNGQRLVLVAGFFDLLHPGHIRLLEQARDHGEILALGVLDDASVSAAFALPGGSRELATKSNVAKSPIRPVTPAAERCEILAALEMVDYAFEMQRSSFPELMTRLAPDVVVEGAEPCSSVSAVAEAAARSGIDAIRIPIEPGHSTSDLIARIAHLYA